jgi:hypothetical protein
LFGCLILFLHGRDIYVSIQRLPPPALHHHLYRRSIQRSARVWTPPEIFHAREKYKVALKQQPKIFCLA